MRTENLPSPGIGPMSLELRKIAAQALSRLETVAPRYTNGANPAGTALATFFTACATAATETAKQAPAATFTPAAKTYSIAAGATAGPTLAKGGSTGAATYTSLNPAVATVNSATGAVTGVSVGSALIQVDIAGDATYKAWTRVYTATVTA